jgi:hypothetical protein
MVHIYPEPSADHAWISTAELSGMILVLFISHIERFHLNE